MHVCSAWMIGRLSLKSVAKNFRQDAPISTVSVTHVTPMSVSKSVGVLLLMLLLVPSCLFTCDVHSYDVVNYLS